MVRKSKYSKFDQKWKCYYEGNFDGKKWDTYEIARKYKCTQSTVRHHLQRFGVKIRSHKEAANLPQAKRKQSESHKGKRHTVKSKRLMSKAHKGKRLTIETRRKLSKANKGSKHPMYGKHHTENTKRLMSNVKKGVKGPNWQGGISYLPYSLKWTKELKLKIKQRDNFECQHPDKNCKGRLTPHHIDYDKMNCTENNLIILCSRHNSKVNFDRKYWTKYFKSHINKTQREKASNDHQRS